MERRSSLPMQTAAGLQQLRSGFARLLPSRFRFHSQMSSTEVNASKLLSRCPLIIITKPLRASVLSSSLQRAVGIEKKQNCRSRELCLASLKSILHGKTILVVDDNAVNLKVAACALKKYGANVECAESGKLAVAKLKPPHEFDACFMDVQMPEMDRFEATRKIREMEGTLNDRAQKGEASEVHANLVHWHTPILAMTTDVIQATHEHCEGWHGWLCFQAV